MTGTKKRAAKKLPKGYISKTANFDLDTIICCLVEGGGSFDDFLDLLCEAIDMPLLMDISYEVIGTVKDGKKQAIKIRITGDASECNEDEED